MNFSVEHYASGENLYNKMAAPICEKHGLTSMEFTVIMFLANNPQYDTATQVVKYRRLTKSHVSISLRALQERGLLVGNYQYQNHRTVHLTLTDAAAPIIADGRKVQENFSKAILSGFSSEEVRLMAEYMERIDKNIDTFTKQIAERQEQNSNGK